VFNEENEIKEKGIKENKMLNKIQKQLAKIK